MAVPTIDFRVDWDRNGFGALGTIDDIAADVRSISFQSGSSGFGSGEQPGRATVVVDNSAGKYNDLNGSSPLAGKLRPFRPVHMNATWSAVTYGVLDGYVENIVPLNDASDPTAEITIIDPLGRWRGVDISVTPANRSYRQLRDATLTALALGAEVTRDLYDGIEIHQVPWAGFTRTDGLSCLTEINTATGSRHFIDPLPSFTNPRYTYSVRDRNYGLEGAVAATHVGGTDFESVEDWPGISGTLINEQTIRPQAIQFDQAFVDLWVDAYLPLHIPASGTATVWATFPSETAQNLAAEYVGTNVASVVVTPFTRSAKIVITATGSAATVTALKLRGNPGYAVDVPSGFAQDLTSQGIFDKQTGPEISSFLIPSQAIADGLADHLVYRFGTPRRRATLLYENRFPQIFDRKLFDWIGVTDTAVPGGFGLSNWRCEIVAESLTIDVAGERWIMRRTVQEAPSQSSVNYFELGTDALGGAAILAR